MVKKGGRTIAGCRRIEKGQVKKYLARGKRVQKAGEGGKEKGKIAHSSKLIVHRKGGRNGNEWERKVWDGVDSGLS